jgi:hypothetical protein
MQGVNGQAFLVAITVSSVVIVIMAFVGRKK